MPSMLAQISCLDVPDPPPRAANVHTQGTKLACGEGGCGACAVEVTRYDVSLGKYPLDPAKLQMYACRSRHMLCDHASISPIHQLCDGQYPPRSLKECIAWTCIAGKERTTSINSCLCPIGSLDGASITTVEGIGNSKAGFHPVQGEGVYAMLT